MVTIDSDNPVELTISAETLCFLVVKAREFDVKTGTVEPDPGSNAIDSDMDEVLMDNEGDATLEELHDAIETLNVDEAAELIAMVWLGRGDYDATEWTEAVRLARERNRSGTAEYLTGIPLLADYLEEGFTMLGHSCEDIEADHL
jgi:hypothetical protein